MAKKFFMGIEVDVLETEEDVLSSCYAPQSPPPAAVNVPPPPQPAAEVKDSYETPVSNLVEEPASSSVEETAVVAAPTPAESASESLNDASQVENLVPAPVEEPVLSKKRRK